MIIGTILGAAIATGLNKLLAGKVKDREKRNYLKIAAYVVCILWGICFVAVISLRSTMDTFIDKRVIGAISPSILETTVVDTNEIASVSSTLQNLQKQGDFLKGDGFITKLAYETFLKKIDDAASAMQKGMTQLSTKGDKDGKLTVHVILRQIKDTSLDALSPYIRRLQFGVFFVLLIYVGIYGGLVIYFRNSSGVIFGSGITYGETQPSEDDTTKPRFQKE